jgi:N,N-dimethylformamidase beta subunit-like protein
MVRSVCVTATAVALCWFLITAPASGQAPTAQAARPAAVNPCTSPANKVVAENCRPGNPRTEWDINSDGDPTIQGFATEMSVNVGESVDFKINSDASKYRIDIYRMGWYGGNGARLIETIQPSVALPQAQPLCITAPQRLVDCGSWKTSASWRVPANAVSGVYVARLVREDNAPQNWRSEIGPQTGPAGSWELPPAFPHNYGALGLGKLEDAMKEKRASHMIFVVRDDAAKSAVLFQTADPTWVAFNRYGGSSLYGSYYQNAVGGGGGAAVNVDNPRTRAYIVSYNRPLDNRANAVGNQFFNGEYPAVAWLERNGYDVSYFSGADSDRRGEKIKEHKVFVSAGHDAYWSAAQRANLEAARDAGVHLAFMGGAAGMWKTRYLPSVEGDNRPNRTLVSYRETLSDGKLDPMPNIWTGTWRDSRPFNPEGSKPENALTGTIGVVGPARNDRLEVPSKYSKVRFWRDTDIAALAANASAVMGRGMLGEEWDEDIDNGSRPAGLIRLSETTVDNVPYVQDWGTTYDSGTATHAMTLYRARSGALVFSAGSTQYSWGLGDLHTYFITPGRLRPDPFGTVKAVQQATVNLFADMGVEPAALQPDLKPARASTDTTGPLAKINSPQDGAVASGLLEVTGVATDTGGTVAAVEISVDAGNTWHAAVGTDTWSYQWQAREGLQQATIVARAVDDSANLGPVSAEVQVRFSRVTPTSGR